MSELRTIIETARQTGDYNPLLSALPYGNFMGYRAATIDGTVRLTLPFAETLVGNANVPSLHGGTVGATLETAALLQLMYTASGEQLPRTIDFTVDYLRQSRTEDVHAEAEILRAGRRVANVRMTAWQSDRSKPVASGRGNFLLA